MWLLPAAIAKTYADTCGTSVSVRVSVRVSGSVSVGVSVGVMVTGSVSVSVLGLGFSRRYVCLNQCGVATASGYSDNLLA